MEPLEGGTTEERIIESRKREALSLGLPETATEREIEAAKLDNQRKKMASDLGLPETATWNEIESASLPKNK